MANPKSVTLPVVAIDQGYFGTKFSLRRASRAGKSIIECGSFPSLAPLVVSERIVHAGAKPLDGVDIPVEGGVYFVGADAALTMHGDLGRVVPDDYPASIEYRALFLGALHHVARSALQDHHDKNQVDVKLLVAGLPMNTYLRSKDQVKAMAKGEFELPPLPGRNSPLKVVVGKSLVVPQPRGAMLSYFSEAVEGIEETVVVLDMGGGTFDWYYWEAGSVVLGRSGAHPKGMLACVFAICDQLKPGLRNNPTMVKRVDAALRSGDETIRMAGEDVSIAPFLKQVDQIINAGVGAMLESIGEHEPVDKFLVTGGGGGVFAAALARLRPQLASRIFTPGDDPVFANVRGFHIQGEMLMTGAKQ